MRSGVVLWVRIRVGERNLFSSEKSKAAVGPTQLPTHLISRYLRGKVHLVPRVRMSRAKPLLLLCLHGVDGENFTCLTFYFIYIYFCFKQISTLLRNTLFRVIT